MPPAKDMAAVSLMSLSVYGALGICFKASVVLPAKGFCLRTSSSISR